VAFFVTAAGLFKCPPNLPKNQLADTNNSGHEVVDLGAEQTAVPQVALRGRSLQVSQTHWYFIGKVRGSTRTFHFFSHDQPRKIEQCLT
jgi:hypothetical protein